jgi:hypothetical protein
VHLRETGPSVPSRSRGPRQSRALPHHLETSSLPRGEGESGQLSPKTPPTPQKVCRVLEGTLTSSGAAGSRSSASGSSSSMRSASAQAATAGPGLGCSPMAEAGAPVAAPLVPGRRANFAPPRPRRSKGLVRAAPPPPGRPWPPPWPRPLPPRDAGPWAAKLLCARQPAGLRLRRGPAPSSQAKAPLGRPGPAPLLPAPPSCSARPPLCAGVSTSQRTPRGRRAGGGGAAHGAAAPAPTPPGRRRPGPVGRSCATPGGREGCGGAGGEVAALPRA